MSFFGGVFAVLIISDLLWWWRAHRAVRHLRSSALWQAGVAIFACVQLGGLALVLSSRLEQPAWDVLLSRPLLALVYLWHLLILLPLVIIAACLWVGRGVVALARRLAFSRSARPAAGPTSEFCKASAVSRRDFMGAALVVAPALLAVSGAGISVEQLRRFRIRRLEIPLLGLPPALDGLTIAQVSDIHVGRFTEGAVLDEVVRATNELAADLVLLPGDLINYALSDLPTGLALVKRLRGRYGVFMCEGNHDLIEDGDRFVRETAAAGVSLLVNATALLEVRGVPLQLLGLRWGHPGAGAGRTAQHGDTAIAKSMEELLTLRRPEAFPILLAHHPHAFDYARGIPLTLAGHTHGGQLMFGPKVGFGPWLFRYWSGLYTKPGQTLVVSNGVGNWFPLRIGAPAEIIHLTLRAAR